MLGEGKQQAYREVDTGAISRRCYIDYQHKTVVRGLGRALAMPQPFQHPGWQARQKDMNGAETRSVGVLVEDDELLAIKDFAAS
jgi:hypothetical protein